MRKCDIKFVSRRPVGNKRECRREAEAGGHIVVDGRRRSGNVARDADLIVESV